MELAQLLYFIASCIVLSDSRTACLLYSSVIISPVSGSTLVMVSVRVSVR